MSIEKLRLVTALSFSILLGCIVLAQGWSEELSQYPMAVWVFRVAVTVSLIATPVLIVRLISAEMSGQKRIRW